MKDLSCIKNVVLLSLFLGMTLGLNAQKTVDATRSGRYFMAGERLSINDLKLLFVDEETRPDWEAAIRSKRAANTIGIIGGFGLGWALAHAIFPPDFDDVHPFERQLKIKNARNLASGMLVTGIVSTLVSFPFHGRYNKYSYRAAVEYNKKLKRTSAARPYFELKTGDIGLSLCYNF